MGQCPGVVRVVGPLHQQLQLGEQRLLTNAARSGSNRRQQGEAGKGGLVASGSKPAAQQVRGPLQQPLEGGIERLRIREG